MQNSNNQAFRWTRQSMDWYEKAAVQGTFHSQIIEEIKPVLSKDDRLCEIACGTGFFTRKIAPLVRQVTVNDADPSALEYFAARLKEGEFPAIERIPGDWRQVLCGASFDIVFFSFFSAFLNDWEPLRKLAAKRIIAVLPAEKAMAASLNREKETYEKVSSFLEKQHISHKTIPMSIDFGQPFPDYDDAMEYFHHYYSMTMDAALRSYLDSKLHQREKDLYFPKIKHLGIVIADL